jgi:hypothetical protein
MIEELLTRSQHKRSNRPTSQPPELILTHPHPRSHPRLLPTMHAPTESLKQVTQNFHDTTVEHVSLRKPRLLNNKGPAKRTTGKQLIQELMQSGHDMRDGFQTEQEKLNRLKEEVKALPDILKPNPNPRTYNMLLEQKKQRRAQHLQELAQFDTEVQRVKDQSSGRSNSLKQNIEQFLKDNENAINDFFSRLDDGTLLGREIDVVGQISGFSNEKSRVLQSKLDNVDKELDQLEEDFLNDVDGIVNNLKFTLVDIAFKLEPEIEEIIAGIRDSFRQDIEDRKAKNSVYYENLKNRVNSMVNDLVERAKVTEARWRVLKHKQTVERYQNEILKDEYVDPLDRRQMIESLDRYLAGVIEKRTNMITDLYNTPVVSLSPAKVQKYLEELTQIDEKVQQAFDEYLNK